MSKETLTHVQRTQDATRSQVIPTACLVCIFEVRTYTQVKFMLGPGTHARARTRTHTQTGHAADEFSGEGIRDSPALAHCEELHTASREQGHDL